MARLGSLGPGDQTNGRHLKFGDLAGQRVDVVVGSSEGFDEIDGFIDGAPQIESRSELVAWLNRRRDSRALEGGGLAVDGLRVGDSRSPLGSESTWVKRPYCLWADEPAKAWCRRPGGSKFSEGVDIRGWSTGFPGCRRLLIRKQMEVSVSMMSRVSALVAGLPSRFKLAFGESTRYFSNRRV